MSVDLRQSALLDYHRLYQCCLGKIPNVNVLPLSDNRARGRPLMRSCRETGLCGSTKSAAEVGFLRFWTVVGRLCGGPHTQTGTRGLTGFWRDGIAPLGADRSSAEGFRGMAAVVRPSSALSGPGSGKQTRQAPS